MPQRRSRHSRESPYHVYHRSNNRELFPIPLDQLWAVIEQELFGLTIKFGIRIHAFVLMKNHFHLLLTSPEEEIGTVMRELLSSITRTVNLESGRIGHLFGGPYKASLVDNPIYYAIVLKYIYRNPVKGKACERVDDYPFSTLRYLLGRERMDIPLSLPLKGYGDELLPEDPILLTEWLNQASPSETDGIVRNALGKKVFKPAKNRFSRQIARFTDAPFTSTTTAIARK